MVHVVLIVVAAFFKAAAAIAHHRIVIPPTDTGESFFTLTPHTNVCMYVCMYQPPSNRRFAAIVSFLSHAMKACAAYQTHTYIHYILLMCRMYVCMGY
jgi:hypothetical protein